MSLIIAQKYSKALLLIIAQKYSKALFKSLRKGSNYSCISRSGCFNQVIQSTDLQDF
jgi:hypothetical protein